MEPVNKTAGADGLADPAALKPCRIWIWMDKNFCENYYPNCGNYLLIGAKSGIMRGKESEEARPATPKSNFVFLLLLGELGTTRAGREPRRVALEAMCEKKPSKLRAELSKGNQYDYR